MEIVKNEPVLIQGLIQAILGLLLAFGISLSDAQTGSIMAVVAVILAIIARMFVTPNNKIGAPPIEPTDPTVAPSGE